MAIPWLIGAAVVAVATAVASSSDDDDEREREERRERSRIRREAVEEREAAKLKYEQKMEKKRAKDFEDFVRGKLKSFVTEVSSSMVQLAVNKREDGLVAAVLKVNQKDLSLKGEITKAEKEIHDMNILNTQIKEMLG